MFSSSITLSDKRRRRKEAVVVSAEASMMAMNERTTDQWAALYSNLVQS